VQILKKESDDLIKTNEDVREAATEMTKMWKLRRMNKVVRIIYTIMLSTKIENSIYSIEHKIKRSNAFLKELERTEVKLTSEQKMKRGAFRRANTTYDKSGDGSAS